MGAPSSALSSPPVTEVSPVNVQGGFQEIWHLKVNDPENQRAFWVRFVLMASRNGFRRVSEVWGVYFQRGANKEVFKVALKQSHDLNSFSALDSSGVRIGECELTSQGSRGSIQSKGHTLRWNLSFRSAREVSCEFIPEPLRKTKLVRIALTTEHEDLRCTGKVQVDGEEISIQDAPAMQGHIRGSGVPRSWVWGHCNSFVDEKGEMADFIFEGLTARTQLVGPLTTPKLSSFFFWYKGQPHRFNGMWDLMHLRSENTLTEWKFQADRGDLSFRGQVKAEHRDFAGLTYEDTNGSLLYCADTKLADMQVHVYRKGKLEATFLSKGSASFEIASRNRSPYVHLLI